MGWQDMSDKSKKDRERDEWARTKRLFWFPLKAIWKVFLAFLFILWVYGMVLNMLLMSMFLLSSGMVQEPSGQMPPTTAATNSQQPDLIQVFVQLLNAPQLQQDQLKQQQQFKQPRQQINAQQKPNARKQPAKQPAKQ